MIPSTIQNRKWFELFNGGNEKVLFSFSFFHHWNGRIFDILTKGTKFWMKFGFEFWLVFNWVPIRFTIEVRNALKCSSGNWNSAVFWGNQFVFRMGIIGLSFPEKVIVD